MGRDSESFTRDCTSFATEVLERARDAAPTREQRNEDHAGRNSIDHLAGQQIRYVTIASLKLLKRMLRTHSDKQVAQIAASIRQLGFNNRVLIDEHNNVIAGAGRIRAAERLGMTSVPTVCLGHMTDAQERTYAIADNKSGELSARDLRNSSMRSLTSSSMRS